MKPKFLLGGVVVAFALVGCVSVVRSTLGAIIPKGPVPTGMPTAAPEGEEWIDLLDDEHAPLWRNLTDDKEIFEVEGDTLHILGKTIVPLRYVGYSGREFDHFELHVEYKAAKGANSGVFLRTQPNDPVNRGFEVQVLEDFGKPPSKHSAGAVYDIVTPMYNMSRPAGEWNSLDIRLQGHAITVVMNGWKVIDTNFSKMTTPLGKFKSAYAEMVPLGHIALQDHGGEVWYRNIRIRPLTVEVGTSQESNDGDKSD